MDINMKVHPMTTFDKEAKRSGLGANHLWDGPFDTTGLPKGKGYSGGSEGMQVSKFDTKYQAGPITQKAKRR